MVHGDWRGALAEDAEDVGGEVVVAVSGAGFEDRCAGSGGGVEVGRLDCSGPYGGDERMVERGGGDGEDVRPEGGRDRVL